LPRLFVAVWPPDWLSAEIASIDRQQIADLRWTRPNHWHITLEFLGSVGVGEVAGLERALRLRLSAFEGPVTALVEGSPEPLSTHVWVLPIEGLNSLASAVRQVTAPWHAQGRVRGPDAGGERPFSAHLTLARTARSAPATLLSQLEGRPISCSWEVREVTLVRSLTLPDGASYTVIRAWPVGH
jgi:RNA 2',3'-cyclic 3'-phosphodiesterase